MGNSVVKEIAELVKWLPMFVDVLTEGTKIDMPVNLHITESKTLILLLHHEGDPMSECSNRIGLSKGAFTTVADHLEKKGLVKREIAWNDRRKCTLLLTEKGKCIANKIDSDYTRHVFDKVSKLQEKDILNLHQALKDMVKIMEILKSGRE